MAVVPRGTTGSACWKEAGAKAGGSNTCTTAHIKREKIAAPTNMIGVITARLPRDNGSLKGGFEGLLVVREYAGQENKRLELVRAVPVRLVMIS